jgi:hypothetical protein
VGCRGYLTNNPATPTYCASMAFQTQHVVEKFRRNVGEYF